MNPTLLPASWALVSIQEVADINPKSFCPLPIASKLPVHFVPMTAVGEEFGGIDISRTRPLGEVQKGYTAFGSNDVLLAKITPCMENGKLAVVPELPEHIGYGSTEFHVLRANTATTAMWLAHFLSQSEFRRFARQHMTGSAGQLRVSTSWLAAAKIPIAPVKEQARIVAKLEELLSDVDAGVAELRAAQKKLTRYRQSLLKAAVEGALTAEWRKHNKPKESGAQLLERILKERRARWEEGQLTKFKGQGKVPPRGWQERYPEPSTPDTKNLPDLPKSWVWASLDQMLSDFRSGTAETSGREITEYPVLKSSAVRQGRVDFDALNYLRAEQSGRNDNYLAIGDVLITRLSGSVEYVGCCAVVRELPVSGIQYPDRVFCGKLLPTLVGSGDFLACCLQSAYARKRIESAAKSTAGHKRISLSDLHPFPIPLPPIEEMREILREVDGARERVEWAELVVEKGSRQSAAQRKNILKAAFSGQLVPQDPNDEPACVLLERIRAERLAKAQSTTKRAVKKRA